MNSGKLTFWKRHFDWFQFVCDGPNMVNDVNAAFLWAWYENGAIASQIHVGPLKLL